MNSWKIRTKFGLIFLLGLVAALGLMSAVYLSIERMRANNDWVTHTHAVLAASMNIRTGMLDIQTGSRGFALTGQEEFLEPMQSGSAFVAQRMTELRGLTSDNPGQQKRLDELTPLIAQAEAYFQGVVETRRKSGIEGASELVSKGEGKAIFDAIQLKLDEIDGEEERLLTERTTASELANRRTNMVVIVGVLLAALLLGAIFFYFTRELLASIEMLRIGADEIGEGKLDTQVAARANDEIGGLAERFNRMARSLRENRDKVAQQDWLKSSVGKVLEVSQGVADLGTLAKAVITEIARSMEAGHAAFYILRNNETTKGEPLLVLQGSYAYRERKNVSNQIRGGEGLVGQCLVEREPILLTQVPPDYVQIHSGLGEAAPLNIFVQPILFEGGVMGVMELATFKEFTPIQREMLSQVGTNLGVVINGVISRQKTEELLAESQRLNEEIQAQSEELQAQSEELRASNEELGQKTSALEEQQAELRASNEELEEKSERLRQQSEELQVVNEELEEKSEAIQRQKTEVERQNAAIEASRRLIEEKARELELASKYKSEFLANMSHELRTPLNSLLILSQTLMDNEEKNLNEEQVESARVIYSSGHDLLALINDILDLSKIEAGRLNLQMDEVDTADVLETLRRQFTPIAQNKGLEFQIESGEGVPEKFTVDRMRLDQILKNLLSNAFKFTHRGCVTLKAHIPTGAESPRSEKLKGSRVIAFTIDDTGIGIAEAKQRIIFEAFQQADGSTSRNYGGTGLGLTISREMAKLLGGEIDLRSREGEGSAFTLYLPLNQAVAETRQGAAPLPVMTAAIEETPPSSEPAPMTSPFLPDDRHDFGDGDRIMLIIEDDAQFAGVLMNLSHKKGYKCVVAGDGRSGLACVSQYSPNAIILDLGLPDMDGFKVLDQIKQNIETRHIPVHVISGREDEGVAARKGAVGFLQKPAGLKDIENVFSKMESLIDSPIRKILVVEDDDATQRAVREILHSKDIILTPAKNGAEALAFIKSQIFDCVILDLELGDVSGFELLRTLNSDDSLYVLPPVIVYTARELTVEEHRELTEYSQSIVIKGANSPERLLDEVSLFLHTVESSLMGQRRRAVRMIHDADQTLLNRRLLLVDDDLRNTFALSKVLRKHGLEVTLADNGQLALQKLEQGAAFDLVLMDIMMPVMDGYEAMRRIRSDARFKSLPIIALTAKAMPEDYGKCIEAGANDYLTKPVEVEKLLSMMRVWLFGKKSGTAIKP